MIFASLGQGHETSPYYKELKRRLLAGTVLLDAVLLVAMWLWQPSLVKYPAFGMALGLFYIGSLMFNAEFPKNKIQIVFSLTRIILIAYIMVQVAGSDVRLLALVTAGLLSYKVILTGEYVLQALPAFRQQGRPPIDIAESP